MFRKKSQEKHKQPENTVLSDSCGYGTKVEANEALRALLFTN